MIVGAFFAAANAIGSLIALVYFLGSTDFTEVERSMSENIVNTWKASQTSALVHGVGSFLILFFGGRWMLRGPKLIDRWVDVGDKAHAEQFNVLETTEANNSCEAPDDNVAG